MLIHVKISAPLLGSTLTATSSICMVIGFPWSSVLFTLTCFRCVTAWEKNHHQSLWSCGKLSLRSFLHLLQPFSILWLLLIWLKVSVFTRSSTHDFKFTSRISETFLKSLYFFPAVIRKKAKFSLYFFQPFFQCISCHKLVVPLVKMVLLLGFCSLW